MTMANCSVLSKFKESYFIKSTPDAFQSPQHVALNAKGSIFYALKYQIEPRIEGEPPQFILALVINEICKYHVLSGDHISFAIDEDFEISRLVRIFEMYVLGDNHVVVVGYEPERYHFTQTVFHLDVSTKKALIVGIRTLTVSRVIGPPFINLSLLDRGRILLCGVRSSEFGRNIRLAISIAANPLEMDLRKDEDLSGLVEDFNKFLSSANGAENEKLMSVFVLSMDEESIILLLSKCSDCLTLAALKTLKIRNGSVWINVAVPDYEKLKTFYWRVRLIYVRIVLPGMVPSYSPAKLFHLYYLDLNNRRFLKVPHRPRCEETSDDQQDSNFSTMFDVDARGGVLIIDQPNSNLQNHAVSYYPNPTRPRSLHQISMYTAYRNYPAFEKSSLLRRMTGMLEWNWKIK
ncbi:unnamed protein product [Caenorhabditis bovis]|uniref:Uncharacterized protein n=1 Tax=Caenorhabditis bovis TaxID=2654633 RepID=A0A8S1EJH7_9PELO|nr:unnamed protein product [Caenorhabditis bovis]